MTANPTPQQPFNPFDIPGCFENYRTSLFDSSSYPSWGKRPANVLFRERLFKRGDFLSVTTTNCPAPNTGRFVSARKLPAGPCNMLGYPTAFKLDAAGKPHDIGTTHFTVGAKTPDTNSELMFVTMLLLARGHDPVAIVFDGGTHTLNAWFSGDEFAFPELIEFTDLCDSRNLDHNLNLNTHGSALPRVYFDGSGQQDEHALIYLAPKEVR